MYAGQWIVRHVWKRSSDSTFLPRCGLFGVGLFLGVTTVSLWQQWTLTFGQDPLFVLAAGFVLMLGMTTSSWKQAIPSDSTGRALFSAVFYLSVWSILFPYWIDTLTTFVGFVRLPVLESTLTKPLIAFALAGMAWLLTGALWSGLIVQAVSFGTCANTSVRRSLAIVACGVAVGQLFNSMVLSSWFGVYAPTIVIGLLACAVSWRARTITMSIIPTTSATEAQSAATTSTFWRLAMTVAAGMLFACVLRLSNQLLPHGSYVLYVESAGTLIGLAAGLLMGKLRCRDADSVCWGGLIAAASASMVLALHPYLVNLGLRMNASFTLVTLLLAGRTVVLMAIAFPFGISLSFLFDRNHQNASSNLITWGSLFVAGTGIGSYLLAGPVSLVTLMCVTAGLVVVSALGSRFQTAGWNCSIRTASGLICLVITAAALPLWASHDNPARSAKLLYSTPTFIAYRSGWAIEHLPYLDEIRMIDRREGNLGPLTLWRGHVAELYVREAGIPRSVVTMASESVPQFAPEALQTIYSLCFSERPSRVLFLGLAAGVPLATSLDFPIQEAVCVEGNQALIDLIRGPLSRETGTDPFTDDRVTLQQVSPELAMMTKSETPFDVIISSPPPSSITDGIAQFTAEFYQRVAKQLADNGLFCQRFECVDYGPEPLQQTLKALQLTFKNVIAVETSIGEFLLFASNSEQSIVPDDFADRLQATHVRKVLARSGIDWASILNQSAYDDAALREISADSRRPANTIINGLLAACSPFEVMRWANKQQEVKEVFSSTRLSPAPYWANKSDQPKALDQELNLSRHSRLFEWLDNAYVPRELHRRLGEITTQQKLIQENPDNVWAYRKALRKQLQENPRSAILQVKAIEQTEQEHPEDLRRQAYFKTLGAAAKHPTPSRDQIAAVEQFLDPYDPLISFFARQETADLLARSNLDAAKELEYRLHVIYFAPATDASVRNVATAIETLVKHPDTIPNDSMRFDALNSLIQTLRVRWEIRQSIPETSAQKVLDDIDQSLIAVEKGVDMMNQLASTSGVSDNDWQSRRKVLNRLIILPLRTYRIALQDRHTRGKAEARAFFDEAAALDNQ